jgi:hypothetical protein
MRCLPGVELVATALALAVAALGAPGLESCLHVERPASAGLPHIVIPPGEIAETGPLEIVDQVREGRGFRRIGFGPPREVTCVQFVPAKEGCSAAKQQPCAHWLAHVEASFWFSPPPFAQGSCRGTHGLVKLPDGEFGGRGEGILDSDCSGVQYPH